MKIKSNFISVLLLIFVSVFSLNAVENKVSQVPAWSYMDLEEPLSKDNGLIMQDGNIFQFLLNKPGIPNEPVLFEVSLSDSIDVSTGKDIVTGEQLFNPDDIAFNKGSKLVYLGGELTKLEAGTTTYYDNNVVTSGDGENIDLIKGASARMELKYTPEFTHQKGALWYTPYTSKLHVSAGGGSSQATVFADEMTFDPTAQKGEAVVVAETLRAVSVYDPWFDKMEQKYDVKYQVDKDEDYRVENWKIKYLAKSDEQHRNFGYTASELTAAAEAAGMSESEYINALSEEERDMWIYPNPDDVTLYTDFQITIREPIEKVKFTSHAQNKIVQSEGSLPVYININDPIRHPDQTAIDEIVCYDTSDAGAGEYTVDAFLITTEILPDYGYELTYRIVEGSSIGTIETTGLDAAENSFRFVPNGERMNADGFMVKNYGNVVIEVTAADINYKEYFTLRYLPSDLRLVAYIGEDAPDKDTESTVPDKWKNGVVLSDTKDETGRYYVDLEESGMWDIYVPKSEEESPSGTMEVELYGLQCIVLYPGESFDLAAVSYIRPSGDARESKTPYYMTTGVPAVDYTKPEGSQKSWTKYAVTFGTYENSEAEEDEIVKDILGFPEYGEIRESSSGLRELVRASGDTPTGRSWWYEDDGSEDGDALTITALKEGICYLNYTLSPVNENTGDVSLDGGTLTGGLYVFVVDPVDQALAAIALEQSSGNPLMSLLIPYDISISQLGSYNKETRTIDDGVYIDGKKHPSHWFLGKYGIVVDSVPNSGNISNDDLQMYTGRSYASFSSRYGDIGNIYLLPFGEQTKTATDIKKNLNLNTSSSSPFEISSERLLEPDFELYNSSNGHQIGDVVVTGEFGVNTFDSLKHLRIVDSDGALTEKNTTKGVFDLSSLRNLVYYQHEGIGKDVGPTLKTLKLPASLEELDLSPKTANADVDKSEDYSAVANYLNVDILYGDSKSSSKLEKLDIGFNHFKDLRIIDFPALTQIEAGGDLTYETSSENTGTRLYVSDVPELTVLSANKTAFNYLVVQWPDLEEENFIDWEEANGVQKKDYIVNSSLPLVTAMRANDSKKLVGVNVAGSLGYLELVNDEKLDFVIGSTAVKESENSYYVPSATEYLSSGQGYYDITRSPDWIKVLNLGGDSYFQQHASGVSVGLFTNADYLGFNPYKNNGMPTHFELRNNGNGSDNITTLKLNKISRLVWDDDNTDDGYGTSNYVSKKKLKTLEINNLIGGLRNKLINIIGDGEDQEGNTTYVSERDRLYDLSLNHATMLTDIKINYVYPDAYVDLSYAGSNSSLIMHIEIESLESDYINLQHLGYADDISINSGSRLPANWSDLVVDLRYSNIIDFHQDFEFVGISNPGTIDINEADATVVIINANPSVLNSKMTVEMKSDNNGLLIEPVVGTTNSFTLTAKDGYGGQTATVTVTASVPDKGTYTEEFTVNIIEVLEIETFESVIKLYPGDITLNGKYDTKLIEFRVYSQGFDKNGTPVGEATDDTSSILTAAKTNPSNFKVSYKFSNNEYIEFSLSELFANVTAKVSDEVLTCSVVLEMKEEEEGTGKVITNTLESDPITITIEGSNRYEIRTDINEVSFHDTDSEPIDIDITLFDKDLNKVVSSENITGTFEYVIDNDSIAKIEQSEGGIKVTPVEKGETTIYIKYQSRTDGPVYEAGIPVKYHTAGSVKATYNYKPSFEVPGLDEDMGCVITTNAKIYCKECGTELNAEEDVNFTFKLFINSELRDPQRATRINKTSVEYLFHFVVESYTFEWVEVTYQGISYDPETGKPKDTAKSLSVVRETPEVAGNRQVLTVKGNTDAMKIERQASDTLITTVDTSITQAAKQERLIALQREAKALNSSDDSAVISLEETPDVKINIYAGTLYLDECNNLRSYIIDNSSTTRHVKYIYLRNCKMLEVIEISAGEPENLYAYSDDSSNKLPLKSVVISGEAGADHLTTLDIHNGSLKSGLLQVGSFKYESGKFYTYNSTKGSWEHNENNMFWEKNGNNLSTLIAYGNEIYGNGHKSSHTTAGKYQLGSGLTNSMNLGSLNVTVKGWFCGLRAEGWFGTWHKVNDAAWVVFSNSRSVSKSSFNLSEIGASENKKEVQIKIYGSGKFLWSESWQPFSGGITIYPFGK